MNESLPPPPPKTLRMAVDLEEWPLSAPFRITGHVFTTTRTVLVRVSDGTHEGRGEAAGVFYHGDTPDGMAERLRAVRDTVEEGATREGTASLLPAGGARNALDCALWDLECRRRGVTAWQLAGLPAPRPLLTTFTVGAGEPDEMARAAAAYAGARAIKLKLVGDGQDGARVAAVRRALPEVRLMVDANQGFGRRELDALWPVLLDCRVELVEQPFPAGEDALLDGYDRPIPIAADESAQGLDDLPGLRGRVEVVNIKLDKCGGLSEGLAMARTARDMGFRVMVGNMTGTSLAMAPAFLVGQLCDVVDLDGPVFLAKDRPPPVVYRDGMVDIPAGLWGNLGG